MKEVLTNSFVLDSFVLVYKVSDEMNMVMHNCHYQKIMNVNCLILLLEVNKMGFSVSSNCYNTSYMDIFL